jgi:chromosome segregation ATPase
MMGPHARARKSIARREVARLLERRRVEIAEALEHEKASVAATRARLQGALVQRDDAISETQSKLALAQRKVKELEADASSWRETLHKERLAWKDELKRSEELVRRVSDLRGCRRVQ